MLRFLFPNKCVLCRKVLPDRQESLCENCRKQLPVFPGSKINLSFLAQWTGLWYYKDDVRLSILRFKFSRQSAYAKTFGKLLAQKLREDGWDQPEVLTWVPISRRRKFRRGYDQTELLARVVAQELGLPLIPTLRTIRHIKPQSTLTTAAHRRANVLGVFRVIDSNAVWGRRILLLDDIVTTGATASECAKVLLSAGAKEVKLATLAVASHDKTSKR